MAAKDTPLRVAGPDSESPIFGFVGRNPGWDGGQPFLTVSLLGPKGADGSRKRKEKGGYLTFSESRAVGIVTGIVHELSDEARAAVMEALTAEDDA